MIGNDIYSLIGNTPILRINGFGVDNLYAKLEYMNPFSSAKDRAAYHMIKGALERGEIDRDTVIVEPTSGNTGVALSAIGSAMGFKVVIVMPESMSEERRKLIRGFGAELVLTAKELGMKGATDKAEELKSTYGNAWIPNQFGNPDNPRAHYETTGPEILRDLPDVGIFVATIGTGGTISGCARYLKEKCSDIKVYGVEPKESPLLSKGIAGPHGIQGIGANFIPENVDRSVIDDYVTVDLNESIATMQEAMRRSGVFGGISSGASLAAALRIARENPERKVLCILTDTGERYLSSALWK